MGNHKRLDRRTARREEAQDRMVARENRGDLGQLARLETLGYGHCKETKRLREATQDD